MPMSKFLVKQQNTLLLLLLLLGNSADYCNLLRYFYFCKVLDWFDWTLFQLQGYGLTSVSCCEMLWCCGVLALFCEDYQQQSCQSSPATLTLTAAAPCLAWGGGSALRGPIPPAGSWFRLQPLDQWKMMGIAASPWLRVLRVLSGSLPKKGTNATRKN